MTNLTPELKAKFEAILMDKVLSESISPNETWTRDMIISLMLQAYELDRWVYVRIDPPVEHQEILVWRHELNCHCIYEFNSHAIDFTFWQPLPNPPIK